MSMIEIIANPVGGRGRAKRLALELESVLRSRRLDTRMYWTKRTGDAAARAAAIAQSCQAQTSASIPHDPRVVIACGGDGTQHEVASALAGSPLPMLIAPGGRCNDWARAWNIPRTGNNLAQRLADIVVAGRRQTAHLAKVDVAAPTDHAAPTSPTAALTSSRFCTVCAIGFDATVSRWVADTTLPVHGRLAYVLGVFACLPRFRPMPVTVETNAGRWSGDAFMVAVAKSPMYGGGIRIAPQADPAQPSVEVTIIRPVGLLSALALLPAVISGRHADSPHVHMLSGHTVTVSLTLAPGDSPRGEEVWADGEPLGCLPAAINITNEPLQLLTP